MASLLMPSSWAVVASSATALRARPWRLRSNHSVSASTAKAQTSSSTICTLRMRAPPRLRASGRPARALAGKA
jgi:hypothetical protein